MENQKTSILDPVTGRQIFYLTGDKFSIWIRKGNNRKIKIAETYSINLPEFLTQFHAHPLSKGHAKYFTRIDTLGNGENIYIFKGMFLNNHTLSVSKEPQTRKLTYKEMQRCNIVVHTLPEKLLNEVMDYNYSPHHFPNQNHRAYLLKLLLGYFFSLKEEDKLAFTKKARLRFEEYIEQVSNEALELL